jgi:hypothetical protein
VLDLIKKRAVLELVAGAVVVLVVGAPAAFGNSAFVNDFVNHLWLVWVQTTAVQHHLVPTYFVSTNTNGVFYPFFMFYGGTLYAATAALAAVLGGRVLVAYVAVILLAIAAAYGGLVWLGRQLGIRGWVAHAPALVFVTSAYYVSDIYGRGAWPEFVAVSMLPLVIAGGWYVARSPNLRVLPTAIFVLATVVLSGSHNITLLLACCYAAGLLAALRLSLGRRFRIPAARARGLLALLALAVAVNAWFLLPDLVHASQTFASQTRYTWASAGEFNTPAVLFDPLRTVPFQSTTSALFVQVPDWFLAWALVTAFSLWTAAGREFRRAAVVLLAALGLLLALITIKPVWNALPAVLRVAQFPFRLNSYVALSISGLVAIAALRLQQVAPNTRHRWLTGLLIVAIVVSSGICVWQLFAPTTSTDRFYADRDDVLYSVHRAPPSWYDTGDYADTSDKVISRPLPHLTVNPNGATGNHATFTIDPPPGRALFAVNVVAGPYAVQIGGGVRRVGRTSRGLAVLERTTDSPGPVQMTLVPAGGSVAIGQWISLAAIGGLLILLTTTVLKRRRKNRKRQSSPPPG